MEKPSELPEIVVDLSEDPSHTKRKGENVINENQGNSSESEQQFAKRVSEYLNSAPFLENLKTIEGLNDKSDMIGATTEYFILNPDGQGVEAFVEELKNRNQKNKNIGANKDDLLLESVKARLGFDTATNDLDAASVKQIYEYIYNHLIRDGYVFHGFNGAFESSIKEHGLDPNQVPWDQKKLDEVAAIGHPYGLNILGLHSVSMPKGTHTSSGKNYYDFMPGNFYQYAVNSPEWFSQFCGLGKNKEAFKNRDYAAAKENVLGWISLIQKVEGEAVQRGQPYPYPLTGADEQKIISLFDECWTRFAAEEQKLKVALIKKSAIQGRDKYDMSYERQLRMNSYETAMKRPRNLAPDATPEKLLNYLLFAAMNGSNEHAKHTFAPKDIVIVDLPAYSKVS